MSKKPESDRQSAHDCRRHRDHPAPEPTRRRLPLAQVFALLADEPQGGDYRTVLGIVAGKIIAGEKICPCCGVKRVHDPNVSCLD
jgi:hypothetical protein